MFRKLKGLLWPAGALATLAVGFFLGLSIEGEEAARLRKTNRLLGEVIRYVDQFYVEDVDVPEMVETGIARMVNSLDPFSEFLKPETREEWDIATHGEYGGLGIVISSQNGVLTVISVMEGTPAYRAGIRPGDRIVEVNGESTEGWSSRDAVQHLRGEPGSQVTIKIARPGLDDLIEMTLTREKIELHTVPYAALLPGKVGYVRLSSFSETAYEELRNAVDSLLQAGAQKLVLDLRDNGGGLLNQAVDVLSLFLPPRSLAVYTQSRIEQFNEEFRTFRPPLVPDTMPVAVLVNRSSASASEIVSGALQDYDRAVIIGDTTYGKGSVQRIFSLSDGYALKLTIAKYYTPSGRSIHRPFHKGDQKDTLEYRTLELKRPVYGGGGIAPDVELQPPEIPRFVLSALGKNLFFQFAVDYAGKHPKPASPDDLALSSQDLEAFRRYLQENGIDFSSCDWDQARDWVERYLLQEIAEKYFGMKGRYAVMLRTDPVMDSTLKILSGFRNLQDLRAWLSGS